MGRLTRRALLASAAAGVLAYGGSRLACRYVPRHHPDFFALLDLAPDGDAARELGRLALAQTRVPGSLAWLDAAMRERPLLRAALAESCPTSRARLVQDQCAIDFAQGRTIRLDGWVLSETEAAICAGRVLADASAGRA